MNKFHYIILFHNSSSKYPPPKVCKKETEHSIYTDKQNETDKFPNISYHKDIINTLGIQQGIEITDKEANYKEEGKIVDGNSATTFTFFHQ